jgi:hypothetical protein
MNILHCSLLKTVFSSNNLKNNKMDLMGMMGKLKETKIKLKRQKRLDTVLVDEQSIDGLLK